MRLNILPGNITCYSMTNMFSYLKKSSIVEIQIYQMDVTQHEGNENKLIYYVENRFYYGFVSGSVWTLAVLIFFISSLIFSFRLLNKCWRRKNHVYESKAIQMMRIKT